MSKASDTIIVGKIGAPNGVKGWVKINSFTQNAQDIFDYAPWLLADGSEIELDQWKTNGKTLVAKLVGIDSRNDAEAVKNAELSILASKLPELEDEFYWKDLIGMQVVTDKGYDLGVIKDMFETGANDVMQIKAKNNDAFGQKERLLPFIYDDVVLNVDKQARSITVDWDPGF
ncbi:ribosome maturation factor RimM [Glaciecola sp. KUL10]|jgi:16S rRNA processing protein RimM|uniref:ribosome maturation factor RimM n=1 Tax=Glaciecola sp. (strain KUL10) TaxID=2161813 RepID=UPI000D784DE6|nr:ribosome maturation factor RimM [Glaciecola sp. KUL10]GBL05820.1 16S rRNA-processing protein RimM [Glaciecola sp. KUL10]